MRINITLLIFIVQPDCIEEARKQERKRGKRREGEGEREHYYELANSHLQ